MNRFLVAAALALALLAPARADVDIPADLHVPNEPPGYCLWCSLEVLGRHQQVPALAGLKDRRKAARGSYATVRGRRVYVPPAAGSPARVRAELAELGVEYEMRPPGKKDPAFLAASLAAGRGVAVGLRLRPAVKHAVVLVGLTPAHARIIDPDRAGRVTVVPRAQFDRLWDGLAITITGGE